MASALDDARMMTRMKITELKREMDAQFAAVREQFAAMRRR